MRREKKKDGPRRSRVQGEIGRASGEVRCTSRRRVRRRFPNFFFLRCVCVRRRCRCLTWSTNFFLSRKTILRVAIRGDWETRETNAGRRRDESRARRRSPHAGGVVLAVGVPRTRRLGGFSARVVSFFSLFLPLKRPPFDEKTREKRHLGGVLLSFNAD